MNPSKSDTVKPHVPKDENLFSSRNPRILNQAVATATSTSTAQQLIHHGHERSPFPPPYNLQPHHSRSFFQRHYSFGTTSHMSSHGLVYPHSTGVSSAPPKQTRGEVYNHYPQQVPTVMPPNASVPPHHRDLPRNDPEVSTSSAATKKVKSATPNQRKLQQQHSGISREILDIAKQLNLPEGKLKFSHQNWKDSLALLYRWKTTIDETELREFAATTKNNGRAYSQSKSVNRFCNYVLQAKDKRRMLSDHWNDSGLKKLVEQTHEEDLPPYDGPWLQDLLDEYFSGSKRTAAYRLAKQQALEERQHKINETWKKMTSRVPSLSMSDLSYLQTMIEKPLSRSIEVVVNGKKTTHAVKIDGFDGQRAVDAASKRSEKPTAIGKVKIFADETGVSVYQQEGMQYDKENTPLIQNRTSI